jgi:hypothetical protein
MMLPHSTRRIAIVLALIATFTAILGFDAVFEESLTDRFIEKSNSDLMGG